MEKIKKFLLKELNILQQKNIVVAVSGGADSMLLLSLLKKLSEDKINIICAHVNHKVRKESEEELIFLRKYCQKNKIVFETMELNQDFKGNFHNYARNKRYLFFEQIIKKYDSKYLFTAHHADDLIETILMRIVRGSTLSGYAGFKLITKNRNYEIVRPLIEVTKENIYDECIKNNVPYVIDASNSSEEYTRNRFRKKIIPLLKEEERNLFKKFLKFSETLNEYDKFISELSKKIYKDIYINSKIDVKKFNAQNIVIQKEMLYMVLVEIYKKDIVLINDKHIKGIINLFNSKKANTSISLPNNRQMLKQYAYVSIETKVCKKEYEYLLEADLKLPNNKNLRFIKQTNDTSNYVCALNSSKISLPLKVRSRKIGDKINVLGMRGNKKIKDIFINEKIPMSKRNEWPVVTDSKDVILWLPGLKKSIYDKSKTGKYDIIIEYK